jgi:hypothetical protein
MSKAIRASVLILLMVCSARADWMQNGAPAPPAPATSTANDPSATTASAPAAQEPADAVATDDAPDGLTRIALDLLAVLPSLF